MPASSKRPTATLAASSACKAAWAAAVHGAELCSFARLLQRQAMHLLSASSVLAMAGSRQSMRSSAHLGVERQLSLHVIVNVLHLSRLGAGQRHCLLPGCLVCPPDVFQLVMHRVRVVNGLPLLAVAQHALAAAGRRCLLPLQLFPRSQFLTG